ncbi:MAG: DUF554 domain-containing protein [Bacteroidales bacterium]|nr:DUF554 domain-containing protein [Bacteroidales bacterium]MBN2758844.1 DUF554 domain-containing protein [Bacteroidales bacterium]
MIGTIINIITVLIGSSIGILLKSKLPEQLVKTVFQSLGLFTLALGFFMALKINSYLIVVFSLVLGAIIGEFFDIEKSIEKLSRKIKNKIKLKDEKFTDGLLTSFLLFCMGSMTILGAFEEGMKGDPSLLITKAVMDGFAAIALSSALGIGVSFSVIPLLIYQGGLTLFANYLGNLFSEEIINELTGLGGILLIGLGINILEIKKIKIFNILPALILVVFFAWLNETFNFSELFKSILNY